MDHADLVGGGSCPQRGIQAMGAVTPNRSLAACGTISRMLLAVLLCVVTFAAAALGDVVEAYFVRAVAELDPHRAARMSVAMYVVGFAGWVVTVKVSLWYAVPEVLGLYLGSVFAVKRQKAEALRRAAGSPTL